MPNVNTRNCGVCHAPFLPGKGIGTGYSYCSRECSGVAWARQLDAQKQASRAPVETRECDRCGKKFETNRPRNRFCSVDCRGRAIYQGE